MGGENDREKKPAPKKAGSRADEHQVPLASATSASGSASKWDVIAPAEISVIGDGVNRATTTTVRITLRGATAQGPRFHVRALDDTFQVVSTPQYLPSQDSAENAANSIVLQFMPRTKGHIESALDIEITDAPRELIRIPISALSDPSVVAAPTTTTTPAPRLSHQLDVPPRLDIGEHVVGSDHLFTVASVTSHGGFARIKAKVVELGGVSKKGDVLEPVHLNALHGFHAASPSDGTYIDTETREEISVRYQPAMPGPSQALLVLTASWSDGLVTTHNVELRARAHKLTEPPSTGVGKRDVPATAATPPPNTGDPNHDFFVALESAHDAVNAIAEKQLEGVQVAQEEARSYQRYAPSAPWWVPLAEIAISMGVAGIAAVVAKQLSTAIGTAILPAGSAVKPSDLKLVIAANDAIKEGLKGIGKKATPEMGKASTKAPRPPVSSSAGQESSNDGINFFSVQRNLLIDRKADNNAHVTRYHANLVPILQTAPKLAAEAVWTLKEALGQGQHVAMHEQLLATESQWVVGVANAAAYDARREPMLEHLRAKVTNLRPDGIIRLDIETDDPIAGYLVVTSAKVDGISQEIADQLWREPLVGIPVPVFVRVRSGKHDARISRDSTGVIRIEGDLPGDHASVEAEKIDGAVAFLARLFGRSLEAWNVPILVSDDASGRGDPKP